MAASLRSPGEVSLRGQLWQPLLGSGKGWGRATLFRHFSISLALGSGSGQSPLPSCAKTGGKGGGRVSHPVPSSLPGLQVMGKGLTRSGSQFSCHALHTDAFNRPGSAAPGAEPAASAAAGWHPAPGQDQQPRKVCKPRNQTVTQPAWESPKQARAASVGAPAWKVCCTRQERLTLHLGRRGKPSLCWT